MNIFTLLERLKVDSDQLQGMEVQEIQRLEKQLKLEQKMDASISTQIVEQLIEILRDHKDELVWVMKCDEIKSVLTSEEGIIEELKVKQNTSSDIIRSFLEKYFLSDI